MAKTTGRDKQPGPGNATRSRNRKAQGFSLIELLIVVAIILIIAAIAIPNFMRARESANESSAVSSIHAVNTAQIAYSSANPGIGFSALLTDLGPAGGGYIDSSLATGTKAGYKFTYVQSTTSTPSQGYTFNADPITRGVTGQRSFYSDQNNATHYNQNTVAVVTDPQL
jgi:type IV pilus assembly protein PilA